MPALNPPIIGGGSPAVLNYPKYDFIDALGGKFGLALNSGNTGGASVMGASISLGTTTEDIQGLFLQPTLGFNRMCAISMLLDGVLTVDWMPFSASLGRTLPIPIGIPADTLVEVQVATNTGVAVTVVPHPYQSDVIPTAVKAVPVGGHASVTAQGVTLAAGAPDAWELIGSIPSNPDALFFNIGPGGKGSGRSSIGSLIDLGISASGASAPEATLMENLLMFSESIGLNLTEYGPYRMDGLVAGQKLWARAANIGGGLVDPISVQATVFQKGA